MKSLILFIVLSIVFMSCSSKSGRRPTGPKTFTKGVVVSVKNSYNNSVKFLIDTTYDGKADAEKWLRTKIDSASIKKGDTVTLVTQQGQIVEWYN